MEFYIDHKLALEALSFKTVDSLDLNTSFNGWRLVKGPTTNGPKDEPQWSLCLQIAVPGQIAFEFVCYYANTNQVHLYVRSSSNGYLNNSISWQRFSIGG